MRTFALIILFVVSGCANVTVRGPHGTTEVPPRDAAVGIVKHLGGGLVGVGASLVTAAIAIGALPVAFIDKDAYFKIMRTASGVTDPLIDFAIDQMEQSVVLLSPSEYRRQSRMPGNRPTPIEVLDESGRTATVDCFTDIDSGVRKCNDVRLNRSS